MNHHETNEQAKRRALGTRKDVTGVSSRFARFRVEFTSTGMQALQGARCALECGEGVNPS
jgi:flavin reductase (DIM6/NTAB) family NADH-FMN oxidoreductase RutF